jgi:hypothetical protein
LEAAETSTFCPKGTYGRLPGLVKLTDCKDCPEGHQCPNDGSIEPEPCVEGYYSDKKAFTCTKCTAGFYCDQIGTTPAKLAAQACPLGYLCPEGTPEKPYHVSATYSCPAGSYCFDSKENECLKGEW